MSQLEKAVTGPIGSIGSGSGSAAAPSAATPSLKLYAAFVVLTGLAMLYAAWPVWRAFLPLEIDVNESWNAYFADDVLAGRSPYPDPDGLLINNYPPLSFYLLGTLAKLGIDPLYAGRFLSIVAITASAFAIGCLIRQFRGSRTAAFVGGVWFWATMARFFDSYFGMNDPQVVALAMMLWGLAWLIRRQAQGRAADPAILLMVVAGFYKHNLFAVPVTAILWLALNDRRAAVRAALLGGGLVALGLALCAAAFGPVFLKSLFTPRDYSVLSALASLGRLQWIAPALLAVAIWGAYRRHGDAVRFSVLFVTIAFIFFFIQKLASGVVDNAQFELAAAAAVGLGLAFEDISSVPAPPGFDAERQRLLLIVILVARLLASSRVAPYLLVASTDFRNDLRERSAFFNSEVARVAAIPGTVICTTRSICLQAGKPFLFDDFVVRQKLATGTRSQSEIDSMVDALGAHWEAIDHRTSAPSL